MSSGGLEESEVPAPLV